MQYRFLDEAEFEEQAAAGAFLESAVVHGRRYGTPRDQVDAALAEGKTVVLEIDVQGARAVKQQRPDAVTVFILPPSMAVLRERLTGRGTESDAHLEERLRNAGAEMAEADGFDHQVVNQDLDDTVAQVRRILDGIPADPKE